MIGEGGVTEYFSSMGWVGLGRVDGKMVGLGWVTKTGPMAMSGLDKHCTNQE